MGLGLRWSLQSELLNSSQLALIKLQPTQSKLKTYLGMLT